MTTLEKRGSLPNGNDTNVVMMLEKRSAGSRKTRRLSLERPVERRSRLNVEGVVTIAIELVLALLPPDVEPEVPHMSDAGRPVQRGARRVKTASASARTRKTSARVCGRSR